MESIDSPSKNGGVLFFLPLSINNVARWHNYQLTMIPFFRKIRYKLARDNQPASPAGRFLKYSRYAIGEILLVVVGILIALYINNWNEERKEKKFELEMLKEVANSLNKDLEFLGMLKQRNEIKENALQTMHQMIESGEQFPDSILLNTYNELTNRSLFIHNSGVYESIKSAGMDKISNDSVRAGLINLYESTIPMISKIMHYFQDYQYSNQDLIGLHNALWTRIVITEPGGSKKIVSKPTSNLFLSQQELIERMKIEQDIMNFNKGHIQSLQFLV